ncbi:hypothetical protein HUZ43_18400 [Raoultella ornithinolytica]|uniref:hypothetical protein n=1 Tax=Raoultella ornithinolytica TaxID=54291 RepID=UPI001EF904BF|nr:hypothetical protein [Raoultella ornithinolytica]ULI45961.1 hypothetical protein HUZ43_18400 [Raoultella ornithinolytica]HDX8326298.1 hypothetical protein [Raoultella ornithinolytica]HDX8338348.1 hypothetical protein [Raoultella ornithinolytica]
MGCTKLCGVDGNSKIIKTDAGYAILDMSLRPEQGDFILIRYDGMTDFGRLMGQSFITRDGEAIEGEGVEVYGVVTFSVNDLRRDDRPI